MLQKKLAGALLAVLGGAMATVSHAGVPVKIHAGHMGRVAGAVMAARLGLGNGASFFARAHGETVRGTTKTREQQTFHGVPVYGRDVVVERDTSGDVLEVDGKVEAALAAEIHSVQPRLNAAQAVAALKAKLGQTRADSWNPQSELVVYPQANGPARLAYRLSYMVSLDHGPSRPMALVDANSGEVIRHWDGLTTGRRGAPAPTAYVAAVGTGGNALIGTTAYDGSGQGHENLIALQAGHTCYLYNPEVATYNANNGWGNNFRMFSFGCAGANPRAWVVGGDSHNGAYSPVADAHHLGSVVFDMYTEWFGDPPLHNADGSAMQLPMITHYGTNYENAFWDGQEMVFGDGHQYFYPFVVLDITGHEISHGFTEQHSGLEYFGQSGGMNEAYSDMAGEAVKYYDRGRNDFMVGADIVKPDTVPLLGMAALRDMCTPSNDGASIDNAGDYSDSLDVHYTSGVYNRAFCLLAKTDGWNTRKAFEVFHDANALYWVPNETFDGGACGVEQSAADRGYSAADVATAFDTVGVHCNQ